MSAHRVAKHLPSDQPARRSGALKWLAAGLVLVGVWGGYQYARGGSDSEEGAKINGLTFSESETASVKKSRSKGSERIHTSSPVETYRVFASKDPFEPLVDSSSASSVTDDTGAPISSGNNHSDSKKGTEESEDTGTSVALVRVTGAGAKVNVNGTVYRVFEGQTFATTFKLLTLQNECGSLLYGDDQFSLCEGDEVVK